ncbi:hypothetical protein SKAU_G00272610 [Synaphobranchus kaupii]|uniref:Uncharacterized protein n=1 Tax=Synaphobranchus kaupii TaxID=118154 RepID=A0A9Q1F0K9_SYNKA|nr:hypothetical protein SKAU_G00272610 [Synaphobranchus kaupii]
MGRCHRPPKQWFLPHYERTLGFPTVEDIIPDPLRHPATVFTRRIREPSPPFARLSSDVPRAPPATAKTALSVGALTGSALSPPLPLCLALEVEEEGGWAARLADAIWLRGFFLHRCVTGQGSEQQGQASELNHRNDTASAINGAMQS